MSQSKSRYTLREDIERMKQNENRTDRSRRMVWIKRFLLLLLFPIGYLLGMLFHLVLFLLVIELFRCMLAKQRFQKQKNHSKEDKQEELVIKTTAEMILLLYFILLGIVFTIYGCLRYALHMPIGSFLLTDWLRYSVVVFLLFEIFVLQFYRKLERKV